MAEIQDLQAMKGLPRRLSGSRIRLQRRRRRLDPWVGKTPWRRAWKPILGCFACRIPWIEEPGRLQSMESQRVGHDRSNSTHACTGYEEFLCHLCADIHLKGYWILQIPGGLRMKPWTTSYIKRFQSALCVLSWHLMLQVLLRKMHFIYRICIQIKGFPGGSVVKNPPAKAGDARNTVSIPGMIGIGMIPWRKWQPTPVFFPVISHVQRSLAGYSPWNHEESDTTE